MQRQKASTEVANAVHVHRALTAHVDRTLPAHVVRCTEDEFTVARVETGAIWLERDPGQQDVIGPIAVPAEVSRLCRVGWNIQATVGRTFGGWRLVKVRSVST